MKKHYEYLKKSHSERGIKEINMLILAEKMNFET